MTLRLDGIFHRCLGAWCSNGKSVVGKFPIWCNDIFAVVGGKLALEKPPAHNAEFRFFDFVRLDQSGKQD